MTTSEQQAVPVAQIDVDLANKIGAAFDYNAGPEETWLEEMLARHRLDAIQTREAELETSILRAALCLSGFAGEGLTIDGFDDPADVFCDLVKLLGLPDADDDDLRAALNGRGGA